MDAVGRSTRAPASPSPREWLAAAIAMAAVAAFGMLCGDLAAGDALSSSDLTLWLLPVLAIATLGPVVRQYAQRRADLADVTVWFAAVYVLHFVVGGIYIWFFGSQFLFVAPPYGDFTCVNAAILMTTAGILAFWLGVWCDIGRHLARTTPTLPSRWSTERVLRTALYALAAGWFIRVAMMYIMAGSIIGWLYQSKDEMLLNFAGLTYLAVFTNLATIGLFALMIHAKATGDARCWRLFWIALGPEVAYRLISGSRNSLIALFFQALLAAYVVSERGHTRTLKMGKYVAGLVVLLLVLFPITTSIRAYGITDPLRVIQADSDAGGAISKVLFLAGHRMHGLDSVALIMHEVPANQSYDAPRQIAMILCSWIPRAFWPDKPEVDLGQTFNQEMLPPNAFPDQASVAITLPGEYYWMGGVIGVLLGMAATGVAWRFFKDYLVAPAHNHSAALVLIVSVPGFLMAVEQNLLTVVSFHALVGLITVGVCILMRAPRSGDGVAP